MQTRLIIAMLMLAAASATASPNRNLVIVNGLGETLDWVDIDDSTTILDFDQLGLYPNDFVVAGSTGIAINSGSNDLYIYDLETRQRIGALFLGNNRNPYVGALLHNDTLYVTNFISSTISKVRVSTRTLINEFAVGDAGDVDSPQGIVIRDRRAYVCLTSFDDLFAYDNGKLEVWDLNADTLVQRLTVGINPQLARFGYDGFLYVLCTGNYSTVEGRLIKIDPVTLTVVDSLFIGGFPGGMAITKQDVAFLTAGGWPPPVQASAKGLHYVPQSRVDNSGGLVFTVDLAGWVLQRGPTNPISTDWGATSAITVSDSTVVVCHFADDTITEIDSAGYVYCRFAVGDGPLAAAKVPACYIRKGDADNNGAFSIADVVWLINYIFEGGAAPVTGGSGDADGNGGISIADAVFLINYIFAGGNAPDSCAD